MTPTLDGVFSARPQHNTITVTHCGIIWPDSWKLVWSAWFDQTVDESHNVLSHLAGTQRLVVSKNDNQKQLDDYIISLGCAVGGGGQSHIIVCDLLCDVESCSLPCLRWCRSMKGAVSSWTTGRYHSKQMGIGWKAFSTRANWNEQLSKSKYVLFHSLLGICIFVSPIPRSSWVEKVKAVGDMYCPGQTKKSPKITDVNSK